MAPAPATCRGELQLVSPEDAELCAMALWERRNTLREEIPQIHYTLSVPDPRTHYFHVRVRFQGPLPNLFQVFLPVWTPGSYLIREYARHVVGLAAKSAGHDLPVERTDKAGWAMAIPSGAKELIVDYDVYAYELTVRTSYLDAHGGVASPTSLFLYHEPWKEYPCTVQVELPRGWDGASGLEAATQPGCFHAGSYDVLADCPILFGELRRYPFGVDNVPHELVVTGPGSARLPRPQFLADLSAIIARAAQMFGGIPYTHYHFLVSVTETGGGGLEHLNSANIMIKPQQWRGGEDYPKLLGLFAHEYFHLWNVKRLRPSMLGPFNYQTEVYTSLLWALEGLTDYFALWLLAQSGVVSPRTVLEQWAQAMSQLEQIPGRFLTSLAESSQEAWIRQYRPDANTANVTISYYLKGNLAGLFLDLELRRHTQGRACLADVLKLLWDRYGDRGYPENSFEDLLIELGGEPLRQILQAYVHGIAPFDETVLETVGLRLQRGFRLPEGERPVWLGVIPVERDGALYARAVERGGPGERAGASPDDELLAVNGRRLATVNQWTQALSWLQPGETAVLHVTHQGSLERLEIQAEPPRPDQYQFVEIEEPSLRQRSSLEQWLGAPLRDET